MMVGGLGFVGCVVYGERFWVVWEVLVSVCWFVAVSEEMFNFRIMT